MPGDLRPDERLVELYLAVGGEYGDHTLDVFRFAADESVFRGLELETIRDAAEHYFEKHWSRHDRNWGDITDLGPGDWQAYGLRLLTTPDDDVTRVHADCGEILHSNEEADRA